MKEIFTKNEIYTNLKDRLTNPFIFSFAVSWLFWNWPITVGLVWYSASNIKELDVASYLDLINKNADGWRNYGYPLICAVFYTISLPLLNWGIDWVNAVIARRNQDSVLKVTRTGYIPTLKFIELKESYDNQINALTEAINNEGKIQVDLNNALAERTKLNSEISKLKNSIAQNNLSIQTQYNNGSIARLRGKWNVVINTGLKILKTKWDIEDTIITDSNLNKFIITDYVCNPLLKEASIEVTEYIESKIGERFYYPNLEWNDDYTSLKTNEKSIKPLYSLEINKLE